MYRPSSEHTGLVGKALGIGYILFANEASFGGDDGATGGIGCVGSDGCGVGTFIGGGGGEGGFVTPVVFDFLIFADDFFSIRVFNDFWLANLREQ